MIGIIIVLVAQLLCAMTYAQNEIRYFEFRESVVIISEIFPRAEIVYFSDGSSLELSISDSIGQSSFIVYDKKMRIREKGQYLGALEAFKEYRRSFDTETGEISIRTATYYVPIPYGKWCYYNKKGVIVREVFHQVNIR